MIDLLFQLMHGALSTYELLRSITYQTHEKTKNEKQMVSVSHCQLSSVECGVRSSLSVNPESRAVTWIPGSTLYCVSEILESGVVWILEADEIIYGVLRICTRNV